MQPIEFTQMVAGHEIRVLCSVWSGRERVLVDGVEVSNKLSWRFKTLHHIELAGQPLEVEVQISSVWEGRLSVVFRHAGQTLAVSRWAMSQAEESDEERRWLADWRLPTWLSSLFWLPYFGLLLLDLLVSFGDDSALYQGVIPLALAALGIAGLAVLLVTWLRGMTLSDARR
ncbi:hypothetical protein [Ferrimonas balearica]|uniref:hypothetical protein n=1 Tax=Ferrimonas balearica TaxID=44012 RepID=UPI001C994B57|nr:hypothetical protein [Ferrimonas balearica]MBY5994056.1 hypothetical protein [Ferrimonas balearica]